MGYWRVGILAFAVFASGCSKSSPPVKCGAGTRLVGEECVANAASASDGGGSSSAEPSSLAPVPKPQVAAPVTKEEALTVLAGGKTEAALPMTDGERRIFSSAKVEGSLTWMAQLKSASGLVVATINTRAETDRGIQGVRHFDPFSAVGVVRNQLVFLGGGNKLTGRAGVVFTAKVFRLSAAGALEEIQSLDVEDTARDDERTTAPAQAPVEHIYASMTQCKIDRAVIGLDKVSVTCSLHNPTVNDVHVRFEASYVAANFAPHMGEGEVVVPRHDAQDATIELAEVDTGRGQHARCICRVTSSTGE